MYYRIIALALAIMLLAGCAQIPKPPAAETIPSSTSAKETTAPTLTSETTEVTETTDTTSAPSETTQVTESPTETSEITEAPTETTSKTEPAHSDLFLSYVSADEMVQFFNEVCLDAEFVNSGDASVLQRWECPVYYGVHGDPTDKDLEVLSILTQWLNTVEGFPGISEAEETWQANMNIYFCNQQELIDRMGDQYYGVDGAFTFWYDSQNTVYDCIICIRTDLDQEVRNSVILEELYNALGPAQDTDLRQESIIYSGYSIPQALHPIDEIILQLLYHPSLACGMTVDQCDAIIRQLYY